jgi:hypothetical protein
MDRLFEKNTLFAESRESLTHQAPVMKRASAGDGKAQLCANPWGQPQDKLWITFLSLFNVDK